MTSIPIIDLKKDRAVVIKELHDACTKYGFFYLINHPISSELMDEMFSQSKRFFEMPEEYKMKYKQDSNNRGFTPMKEETLDPKHQKCGDTKEGYYIGREVGIDEEDAKKPLHGPNQWPEEKELPGWRATMEKYFKAGYGTGMVLSRLLSEALELPKGFFDRPGVLDKPLTFLRLLHYSTEASDPENGVFACGAHSDYGMITLLATDEEPGLEVFLRDRLVNDDHSAPLDAGKWVPVPPIKHALIVNLGDCFERWTNKKYVSTVHRVIRGPSKRGRYSAPYFFEPNFDCDITVFENCTSESNPPQFAPIKYGQYLLDKYNATHADFNGGMK